MDENQSSPVTVVSNPATDEQMSIQDDLRERYWRAAERIAERNRDKDPEAELPFITEVVEEVRQERYEREQAQTKNGR